MAFAVFCNKEGVRVRISSYKAWVITPSGAATGKTPKDATLMVLAAPYIWSKEVQRE